MKDCRSVSFCLGATLLVAAQLLTAQSRPLSGADASELAAGKRIFDAQCAWCHGTDGTGGAGPSLQTPRSPACRHRRRSRLDPAERHRRNRDAGIPVVVDRHHGVANGGLRAVPGPQAGRARSGRSRARGAAIYEARGCQTCHVIAGRGTALGPELTAIGALRGSAYLRESIVKPEAAHPPGYLVVRAVPRAGAEVRGIRVDEDAFWIHVRDAAGTLHVLEKSSCSGWTVSSPVL